MLREKDASRLGKSLAITRIQESLAFPSSTLAFPSDFVKFPSDETARVALGKNVPSSFLAPSCRKNEVSDA
jgi:hypothetical protein